MKKKIDKRTKAYKDSIKNKPAKGLGDLVEDITTATGIKKVVKTIFGDDCGCDGRKIKLNNLPKLRTDKAYRCLSEEQYNEYKNYVERRTLKYETADVKMIIRLYAHIFAKQHQMPTCRTCQGSINSIKKLEDRLDVVYESYKKEING